MDIGQGLGNENVHEEGLGNRNGYRARLSE